MATRTRGQSPTHIISTRSLEHTQRSLRQYLGPSNCWLTEVIKENNLGANNPKIIEIKQKEIRDLISRGTFSEALRTELPDGANMITAGYVLAMKSEGGKEERYKARYVAEGHIDIMKDYLVHGAQKFQCVSVRIILTIAKGESILQMDCRRQFRITTIR